MRTLGDIREVRDGIRWLIRLRVVAALGVFITTYLTEFALKLEIGFTGLYVTALFILVYNLLFAIFFRRGEGIWSTRINANGQIFLDFLSLTVLLHFAGGIENPFMSYYVYHTIVTAILLTRVEATIHTFLAIVMFGTMVMLEHLEIIKHWHLGISPHLTFQEWPFHTLGPFFALVSTLLIVLYVTIAISERSRRKNVEISTIREQLTRREQPRSEEEILREEKLASLGKMSAGIAHEINNPLTIILTNVEMAIEDMESDNDTRELLEIVKEEVVRCRQIIGKLLTFSRGEGVGRKLCEAGNVLEDSIALIRNYASLNGVEIDKDIPSETIQCRINQNHMKQVLFNIMMNGIQAMSDGGRLKVGLNQRAGECVMFTVEDTGCGISKSLLSKIFDPFFTTKKTGEGTGLGLSICHRLVEIHHGIIDIESVEKKGTKVTVRLPCGQ